MFLRWPYCGLSVPLKYVCSLNLTSKIILWNMTVTIPFHFIFLNKFILIYSFLTGRVNQNCTMQLAVWMLFVKWSLCILHFPETSKNSVIHCVLIQIALYFLKTSTRCILEDFIHIFIVLLATYTVKSLYNECVADWFPYMELRFWLNGGGHAVAQLAEALHYKLEGHGFHSKCGDGVFSLT